MRAALRATIAIALLLVLALSRAGCRASLPPPNILFLITDDQSYPHAGAYGSAWIETPGFDRLAREGILFHNAFVSAPSCGPSRGSVLSGLDFYRLGEAAMNHTVWPAGISVYPDLLAAAGYHVGHTGKGWGPGNWQVSGRDHNPAGPAYSSIESSPPAEHLNPIDYAANFEAFLGSRPPGAPFCFWVGFSEPHREFEEGIGARHGIEPARIPVPGFLPDSPEVRSDLADYAFEIQYLDGHLTKILHVLEARKELDRTLLVMTSDNGMAFPRAKATLYDYGTRVPLAVRWGGQVAPGREVFDFVSLTDLAPTFLEAAAIPVPSAMTGRSLLPLLRSEASGQIEEDRDQAVFGIERHYPGSRPEGAGYPMRAIRTGSYLYVRNQTPERFPAGDLPGPTWPADDPTGGFGDTDGSPTKSHLWLQRERHPELAELAFGLRPAEELYHVTEDPFQRINLAGDPGLAEVRRSLARRLEQHLTRTGDPRALGQGERLDAFMRRFPVIGSNR